MTSLQAFILALIILTIQTITLIVFGLMFGVRGAVGTSFLFLVFNIFLLALGNHLCVVKVDQYENKFKELRK